MKRRAIVTMLVMFITGLAACGNVPVIKTIKPAHAMPGAVVEIMGSNFGASQGKGSVSIGKLVVAADHIVAWSADSVKMRVPATAPTGKTYIQLTNDADLPSNKKDFTVDAEGATGTKTVVVGNRSVPSLEVYNVAPRAPVAYTLDLNSAGATTELRGLATSAAHQKIFASLVRRTPAGEESSTLVVFGGAEGDVTAATLVDVGVQPTGLAVSPSGNRVYVAATASGVLTVVNAVDNTVIADLAVDLGALSYGFEPLYVTAFASPATDDEGDWVAVAGNNWFLGRAEVITYAPNTAEPVVSVVAIDGLSLQTPLAVSAATGHAWLAGSQGGSVAVALLDLGHGQVLDTQAFGAGLTLTGFAGTVSMATDVVADPLGTEVYVALPGAGVAALAMTTDSTLAPEAELFAVEGAYRLLPVGPLACEAEADSCTSGSLLVTRPAAGTVARIAVDGTVAPDYMKTSPEPTEIAAFPTLEQ